MDRVLLHGTPYTREDVFDRFLAHARTATTANELHARLLEARAGLMSLGLFKSVRFVVDCAASQHHTNVAVVADEIPRKEYGVGVGGGAADTAVLTASLAIHNVFGRGEHWQSSVSRSAPGTSDYSSLDAALRKPLLFLRGPLGRSLVIEGHLTTIDRASSGRFHETVFSVEAGHERAQGPLFTALKLGHSARRLIAQEGASWANAEQSGWSSKSWLSYEWGWDERDHPLIPSKGVLGKGRVELAGDHTTLSPTFLKAELVGNVAVPLDIGGSLVLRGRVGHVLPLRGSPDVGFAHPSVNSVDVFHLGGAHEVPGYQLRGIGRTSAGESLGSCSYWLVSSHYLFGLGSWFPDFMKGQLHASACGVANVLGGTAAEQGVLAAVQGNSVRASAGVGMIAAIVGAGRLTLTWSRTFNAQQYDSTTNYIQLGFTTAWD